MKQFIFLIVVMAFCAFRSLWDPFWAALLYYGFSVLRPQSIWYWALPQGIRWSLYAAVIALVATVLHARSLGARVAPGRFLLLLVLFGLFVLGSYLGALDKETASGPGWDYGKIIIMTLVGCFVVTNLRHVRYLGWMTFLCLSYLVYEFNLLYLDRGGLHPDYLSYSGLDNNGSGLMFAMMIPFGYYFFWAERRWWRWGYLFCALAGAHAVMITFSRGAMLSAIVAGFGMILTSKRGRLQNLGVAAVLGIAALALAGPEVRARFLSISQKDRDVSAQSRFGSWEAGWKIAKDFPFFGCGPRNSNLIIKAYGADAEGRTIHNVYIQIAADIGIPAAALYITLILTCLLRLRRAARQSQGLLDQPEQRWHHHICNACFWSLGTFSFGSVFLSVETFELPYVLMLVGAVAPAVAAKAAPAAKPVLIPGVPAGGTIQAPAGGSAR